MAVLVEEAYGRTRALYMKRSHFSQLTGGVVGLELATSVGDRGAAGEVGEMPSSVGEGSTCIAPALLMVSG